MAEAGSNEPSQPTAAQGGYRVLARKYRPRDFSGLIGQEPMVRTLTNAFAVGRIAQAWMLTGVRGVGKTTTARILARALNYRTAEIDRPSIELAQLGEHCQAIMEGRHVDVVEMDAASHTGIGDIREIIDQVRYAPVSARYKVYIIDEVHMLSTQAFNGLLKTLEEPPPHVKFIFATTEIRKVPITVLSRCQRFDLRRVDAGMLAGHLAGIAGLEQVEADPAALAMIARAAEGSVRDAQSILDQAIAHGGGHVAALAVRDMLGLADRARVIDLFAHLMAGDVASALTEYRAQYDGGADPAVILTDLAEFTHLVTRLRYVPEAAGDAALTEDERRRGAEFAGALSIRILSRIWQMLLKGIAEVNSAGSPVAAGEMVLIRIAHAADLPTLDEALKSVTNGAPLPASSAMPRLPAGAAPQSAGYEAEAARHPLPAPSSGGAQTMRLVETAERPDLAAPAPEPAAPLEVGPASLADIVDLAEKNRDVQFKIQLKKFVRPVRIEPGKLEISLTEDAPKTLVGDISSRLKRWTGRNWFVTVSREEGGRTLAEDETGKRETALLDARADPAVAAILQRFPGARIIDVRVPEIVGAEPAELNSVEAVPSPDDDDD